MSRFKWYSIEDESKYDQVMQELIADMKEYLPKIKDNKAGDAKNTQTAGEPKPKPLTIILAMHILCYPTCL